MNGDKKEKKGYSDNPERKSIVHHGTPIPQTLMDSWIESFKYTSTASAKKLWENTGQEGEFPEQVMLDYMTGGGKNIVGYTLPSEYMNKYKGTGEGDPDWTASAMNASGRYTTLDTNLADAENVLSKRWKMDRKSPDTITFNEDSWLNNLLGFQETSSHEPIHYMFSHGKNMTGTPEKNPASQDAYDKVIEETYKENPEFLLELFQRDFNQPKVYREFKAVFGDKTDNAK